MAPEIDWTRSLKNKLHIWRGSKRRPKSIKKIRVLSPTTYRQRWPFVANAPLGLRNPRFTMNPEQQKILEGYADEIKENFGAGAHSNAMPDPIYDALLFGMLGRVSLGDYESLFPRVWFAAGAEHVVDVVACWPRAREIVSNDASVKLVARQTEGIERVLLARIRRQLGSLSNKEHDAAIARAATHFSNDETSLTTRAHLAYLFPEQTAWGNAVIDRLPRVDEGGEEQRMHLHGLMFASGADVEHLTKLVDLCDPSHVDPPNSTRACSMGPAYEPLYALIDRFEEDARDILITMLRFPWAHSPVALILMLCHIPHQDVFDALASAWSPGWPRHKQLTTFFRCHPEMALSALEKRDVLGLQSVAALDEIRRELLTVHRRMHAESEDAHRFAGREDFTGVLADPPWHHDEREETAAKRDKPPKALGNLALLDDTLSFRDPESVDAFRKEHDTLIATLDFNASENYWRGVSRDRIHNYLEQAHPGWIPLPNDLQGVTCEVADRYVETLPVDYLRRVPARDVRSTYPWLAVRQELFGPWLESLSRKEDVLEACALISWPGLAPVVAEMLGTKTMREGALEWIEANPRDAAIGAIPAYLGTRGAKKRKHLEDLLRSAHQADEDTFDEVITAYAKAHGEELRDFLPDFEDAASAYPKKLPELPVFWSPAAYPPILLEKDLSQRIPTDICDDIGVMLVFSPPGKPYVGLLELREQADATSLGEFTWALFKSWGRAGSPLDDEWVVRALAQFGGPEVARELPYFLEGWLRSTYYKRGEKVIEAIRPGCNEYTLEALWRYLHGGHEQNALELTRAKLRELFEDDACADFAPHFDRAAPTFGIGKDHRIKLGGASGKGLKVWLDEDLEPHLSDSDAGLDELEEPIRLRWERLGRLCAWQARFQSRRFERAMRTQRAWSIEDWKNDILDHPLLGMLAHKLLWGVYKKRDLIHAFRIDEENALVNVEDEPFDLTAFTDHNIRLVHPLEMTDDAIVSWTQVLSDYEVIQPFEQLARKTWGADEARALIRGDLASFPAALGALQGMFEDHVWVSPPSRKRSYPIAKINRRVYLRGHKSTLSVKVRTTAAYYHAYFPGTKLDGAEEIDVKVTLGTKNTDFSDFCPVDLSELVWELERARRAGE